MLAYDPKTDTFSLVWGRKTVAVNVKREQVLQLIAEASDALVAAGRERVGSATAD